MKLMNKKAFAMLALLSITGYSFGYDYGITNVSETPLIVRLKVKGGGYVVDLVPSTERALFKFWGGDIALCLESIQVAPVNLTKTYQGTNPKYKGKNVMEIHAMGGDIRGNTPEHEAFYSLAEAHALQSVEMVMEPKAVFDETVKGAQALLKGLDTLGCQALEVAMKASPEGQATDTVKQILKTITTEDKNAKEKCSFGLGQLAKASGRLAGNTLCKSRDFTIISTGEKAKKVVAGRTIILPYDEYIAFTVTGE